MLIPTYYLLSKICDIFATRRRILLKINKNYFRGGQVRCKARAEPSSLELCRAAALTRRSQVK